MDGEWMPLAKAAKVLGVTEPTVRNWVKRLILRSKKGHGESLVDHVLVPAGGVKRSKQGRPSRETNLSPVSVLVDDNENEQYLQETI